MTHVSERALILAPQGRDAQVAAAMLAEAGIDNFICNEVTDLVSEIRAGAGFALITEEALASADLRSLAAWLDDQAEWSDFPFVLLTHRSGGLERNPVAVRLLRTLGNVTFLERPFHPTTLISLAQSALRARRRQYEARARLLELHDLAADLERRVEERTAERQRALAQLHEAQKLETLGQLTGGVAHDFNNLLTPIVGALDLLQRKVVGSDSRTERLIGNALQSAERAKLLVQRLLGFARRQTLTTGSVDLTRLLEGMRDLIGSSVGSTVELRIRHEPDLPPVLADPNQLELSILNLCVNARDAMPNGGLLTIIAQQAVVDPGRDVDLRPGLYVRLSVIDTGGGMDQETLARAVEPFFSTKETGRGTGLGLSMVHGLAAQLGGAFALSSAPDKGTRADLYLPLAGAEKAAQPSAKPAGSVRQVRPLRLLLVDDEELVRVGTAEMLREQGHEVVEASNGQQALSLLEEQAIDAVVTDYKMPRMDGAQLADRIRAIRPGLPILLITGYTGSTNDSLGLPRLAKPFNQADLAEALADAVYSDDNVFRLPVRTGKSSRKD
ncbi:MAG TPA: response regulator [Allosphingosinicella sp.]|nr:response regulator [Allosphingosinicella sp.]